MDSLEQMSSHLLNTWGEKTLEELKIEALAEESGIKFDSLRVLTRAKVLGICYVVSERKLPEAFIRPNKVSHA